LLLRLSGTEPAFRIFAEFEDEEVCEKLTKESKKYIDEVQTLLIKEK
jgi:phosphomannomutase